MLRISVPDEKFFVCKFLKGLPPNRASPGSTTTAAFLKIYHLVFFSFFYKQALFIFQDGETIAEKGFFTGYDDFVWFTGKFYFVI